MGLLNRRSYEGEAALFGFLGLAGGVANAGASMLAAFVVYRIVYYLLPLAGAACVALAADMRTKPVAVVAR